MNKEQIEFIEDLQDRIISIEEKLPDFATWSFLHESLKNQFNYTALIDRRAKDQGKRIRKLGKEIKERKGK